MDDRVVISLLRHGMTKENERAAYIGWTNSSLSRSGKDQVLEFKNQRQETDFVFSSDLHRCIETANILFPQHNVAWIKELRELNFGNFEGKTYAELKEVTAYQYWLDHIDSSRPEGGESFDEFGSRIQEGWNKVVKKVLVDNIQTTTIVTHGGVIRYLLSMFSPEQRSFFDWKIPYVGGYKLVWMKEDFRRGRKCMSLQEVRTTENPHG